MKILIKKGNKGSKDYLYFVDMQQEAFSITKLSVLINNIALNELRINKEKIERNNNFFFEEAIKESINLAKQNIEFREWLNKDENLTKWSKKYFLDKNKIKKEIINEIQLTFEDFKNGI